MAVDKIWIIKPEDVQTYLRSSPGLSLRLFGTVPVRLLFCKKLKDMN